jgi:hypothetical protein
MLGARVDAAATSCICRHQTQERQTAPSMQHGHHFDDVAYREESLDMSHPLSHDGSMSSSPSTPRAIKHHSTRRDDPYTRGDPYIRGDSYMRGDPYVSHRRPPLSAVCSCAQASLIRCLRMLGHLLGQKALYIFASLCRGRSLIKLLCSDHEAVN